MGPVALKIYSTLAGGAATPSVAVGVWCDGAEKALISQGLPLPPSLPLLRPSALSRSCRGLSRGVSVPERSQSSFGNLDSGSLCTHAHAHTHTHAHSLAHTHSGSPHGHIEQTRSFIYLRGWPGRTLLAQLSSPEVSATSGPGGSLPGVQPCAVCRHRCLKCPGWRRRLLPDRFPAQRCGPGTSTSELLHPGLFRPRPSSRPRLPGSGLGRLRRCRRRRRCCEHIPPRGLNAGAGVGRESGSPNFLSTAPPWQPRTSQEGSCGKPGESSPLGAASAQGRGSLRPGAGRPPRK